MKLKDCRIFQGLSEEKIKAVRSQLGLTTISYEKGKTIIEENSIVKEIGIVMSGGLCMSKFTVDEKEILMQKLIPSYVVGAEIAFTRRQDSPYAVYTTEETEIEWFLVERIMEKGYLDDDIRLTLLSNIMYFIADENMRKYYKIEAISIRGVREKIIRYLSIQQKKKESNKIYLKFNREEWANFLGINRSVLSHELKMMENEGMISFNKNLFEIIKF